jgi:NAD(P)-dependent dehydrogenase (short-subunit alcohol dehydrogenase family)
MSTNPYAKEHSNPKGEGDSRPTAIKVLEDEGLIGKLSGKVFLITGSSSGIGIETVRAIHSTGADVFMQVRNLEKGQKVLNNIKSSSPGNGKLELLLIDLESFESIRTGVKNFLQETSKLNVLINNAGKIFHFLFDKPNKCRG